MAVRTLDDIRRIVGDSNRSAILSNELVVCLIWKESGFDDAARNSASTATGLMQLTKSAVQDVNNNTPKGVHFDYGDMGDASKNVQCGTYYVDMRIKRSGGDMKKGLERFGTGSGYADNLLACESCMKGKQPPNTADQLTPCLFAIHS